jgi:glutathione S-transferase
MRRSVPQDARGDAARIDCGVHSEETRMIRLHGFAMSNYYNKVKLILLEKGVPFEEVVYLPGSADVRALSPLQKVPFLETPQGPLCESAVIAEWLEAAHPEPGLLPADPWAAAKVRELATFMELHLELVVRQVYGQAFFGGTHSEAYKARVRAQLDKNIPAFLRLARFAPYVAGAEYTLADCAAFVHLPTLALATRAVFGEDLLAQHGVDWKGYVKHLGERPAAQRVNADRKADTVSAAYIAKVSAAAARSA